MIEDIDICWSLSITMNFEKFRFEDIFITIGSVILLLFFLDLFPCRYFFFLCLSLSLNVAYQIKSIIFSPLPMNMTVLDCNCDD